jgi:hypothetical protein
MDEDNQRCPWWVELAGIKTTEEFGMRTGIGNQSDVCGEERERERERERKREREREMKLQ